MRSERGGSDCFEKYQQGSKSSCVPTNARFHTRVYVPFPDSEGPYTIAVTNLRDVPVGATVGETYKTSVFVGEIGGVSYYHTHIKRRDLAYLGAIPAAPSFTL